MRLEVNHPLYALAFLGGGDLIARAASWSAGPTSPAAPAAARGDSRSRSAVAWLLVDLAMILLLPAVVLVSGESSFRLTDRFLFLLHSRYIVEFLSLRTWLLGLTPAQLVAQGSLVPLIALPLAALLWPTDLTGGWRVGWHALLLVAVGAGTVYAYIFLLGLTGGSAAIGVARAAAAAALWFLLPLSFRGPQLAPPWVTALVIALVPALLLLLVSLLQMRWWGKAAALWLGALVVTAAVTLKVDHGSMRTAAGRAVAGALPFPVLVLAPVFAVRAPFVRPNVDVVTRDASLWLRRRLGDQTGVILAAPTATTHMIWFGGFRGIGTPYWENLDGLRASRTDRSRRLARPRRRTAAARGRRGKANRADHGRALARRARRGDPGGKRESILPGRRSP